MVLSFLGLGANLGEDPRANLARSVQMLSSPQIRPLRQAPLFGSRPVGPQDQPDFINSALEVETNLAPLMLLDALKAVEEAMGREKTRRWGPRLIDIDLLLYGEAIIDLPRLTVPHRSMIERRFVLAPLATLIPDHRLPGDGRTVAECLAALQDDPASVWELP